MSAFESASFNWYFQNVTRFVRVTGMLGDLIRLEGLAPLALRLFLKAQNMIYGTMDDITAELAKDEGPNKE